MDALLRLTGLVQQHKEYDYGALAALPDQIDDVSQMAPGRQGRAVRLTTLLEAAQPSSESQYITLEAEGGYSASVPLDAVRDQAIILYRIGDGPLPHEQGGPLRFLIPDAAACKTAEVDSCANVKHLLAIVLSIGPGKDTRPRTMREHAKLHHEESQRP